MYEKIGLLVVVSLAMFFRTLRLGFVSDDIAAARSAYQPKNLWQRFYIQMIGGKHFFPQEAHLITLVLHTLVCVFVYLALGRDDVSFLAALLFCVNPRNNQGSVWISGRVSYVIPTLLFLVSMAVPFLSPLALLYATRAATTFLTPLGFIGSPRWWLVFVGLVCCATNIRQFRAQVKNKIEAEALTLDKEFSFKKLILAVKAYGFYFFMCLVPDKLTFYHSFLQSGAGSGNEFMRKRAYALDKAFWFGCAVLAAFPTYAILHGWDGICWGVWWFSISILPYLNLIRVQQEIAERYCYGALVGLMFALASILVNFPYLAVAFLSVYAVRLWYLIPAYKDEYWVRENCVREDPASWFAWHMRALHRWDVHSYHEAMTLWVMARMLSPQEFKLSFNLAVALKLLNKHQESKAMLEEAEKNIIKGQEAMAHSVIKNFKNGKYAILI